MNNWRNTYSSKLVSAETALKNVESGNRVVIAHACGEPPTLVDALVARAPELSNVEIVHMVAMGPAKYAQPGMEKSFRHKSKTGGNVKEGVPLQSWARSISATLRASEMIPYSIDNLCHQHRAVDVNCVDRLRGHCYARTADVMIAPCATHRASAQTDGELRIWTVVAHFKTDCLQDAPDGLSNRRALDFRITTTAKVNADTVHCYRLPELVPSLNCR